MIRMRDLIVITAISIFASSKESATSREAEQATKQIEQRFWSSVSLVIICVGIYGTIGLVALIIP